MKMTIGRITRTAMLAVAFMLCATSAWAAPYVMSNADGSAYHWDGGYNWDSGAASPNEISFTLSNPSGVWANGTFPNSGKVALTCISISGRKDGSNADIHHIVLQETGGNSYTSSSVEVLDGASNTENCFVTTLAGGDSDHTYNEAGTYGQGTGQKTVNVYFDNVAVDVTKAITLTTYTAATTKGKLGTSVVTSPKSSTSNWKAAMRVYGTYYYDTDTSVSALNTIIDAASDSEVVFVLADGVEIDIDAAFSTASHTVKIVSAGSITLFAASQPATTHFTNVDFSGVKGGVLRSWLTPGVVGYNFRSTSGSDTSVALVSGGTWLPASTANEASGSTTAMFADGLSTFTWSSANTWAYSSGTILNGYLDDPSPQASVSLSNVPYEAYDLIVYVGTDTDNSKFRPVTVNGTSYTWDSSSSQTTTGSGSWGLSQQLVADYGINALRIKDLSGPLAIKGGSNSGGRGCIAAIQIMPAGTLDSDYVLTLDGTATSWSTGTWTFNGETVSAPTVAHSVEIVASASTTLTIDTAATVGHLIINGTGDATVTISKGSAALTTKQVTVESGILKHGSDNSPLGSPSLIVVNDGGAMDLGTAPSSGYYTKIAGQGVLKDGVYTGALFSSANITGGSAQLCGITLTANATIRCDKDWGIIRSGWNPGTLNLGSYTLTKVGSENFWICNVTDSASGNIVVSEGRFTTIKNKSTFSNATLTIGAGATLRMDTSDGGGATDLEVKNLICDAGSTVNIAAARTLTVTTALTANGTMNPLGTVTCNGNMTVGGDVVVPSDKTWTVTGMLTVADGGKLEIKNNALVPGTLALSDGGTLKIANVSDAAHKVTAGTVTFPASGLATIDVSDIPEVEEDGEVEVLAGSTSLPADVSTLRIVGKKYSLESESNALKVVNDGGLTWNSTDGWTKDVSKYGDATITSPGTVALGGTSLSFNSVTLSGSGTVSFSATGSETVSIKNLEIGAGVTLTANSALDLTGCEITGDGTLDIPVGTTYAMNGVTSSAKVTVEGTLETSGTTTLSAANTSAQGSLLHIVGGTTTLASAWKGIAGNITIDYGATLTMGASYNGASNTYWEHFSEQSSTCVDIGGTLNMGGYIWFFGANNSVKLRSRAEVYGSGRSGSSSYGNWVWMNDGPADGALHAYGNATIDLTINTIEGKSPRFEIDAGATLEIRKNFTPQDGEHYAGGSITKAGAGTLDLSAITPTKPITINAGKVDVDEIPSASVTINTAGTLELKCGTDSNDADTADLSHIGGTGTVIISTASGWHTYPNADARMLPTTLTLKDEVANALIITKPNGETAIGSLTGSKNIRSDWKDNGSDGRILKVIQSKDTEWQGSFQNNRLTEFKVAGSGNGGTLKLSATFDSTITVPLTVESTGSVNLTGTYYGAATVNGEFGGTGSLTGALTFNAGSTFKVWETDADGLVATGALTLPTSSGDKVTVDVSNLTIGATASKDLLTVGSGMNANKFTQTGNTGTHMLSASGQTLSLIPIAATLTSNGVTTPYATVDQAVGLLTNPNLPGDSYVTLVHGTTSDLSYTAEQLVTYNIVYDSVNNRYVLAEAKISTTLYPTIEAAIADAGENDTVELARNISKTEVSVNKEVEFSEGDYTFTGSFTGNGTITLSAMLKSASSDRWAEGWEGVVVLPTITEGAANFNNYGNAYSVVRVTSMTGGYLPPDAAINTTVDIPSGATMTITGFSPSKPNVIKAITGGGTLALNVTATESNDLLDVGNWDAWKGNDGYSAYLRIGDVSGFSGSLSPGTSTGIVIGDTKPAYNTVGGKIILNSGKTATVGASATWTATTIQVDGTLTVSNTSTLTGTITGGGTLAYASGAVPNSSTTAPTFDSSLWTGTVELPVFAASGIKLAEYGTTNSKIKINGITSGHLMWENQVIHAEVVLNGHMNITQTSHRSYAYDHISGTGSFSVGNSDTSDYDPTTLTISKLDVASGSVGMAVTNNTGTALTITELALPEGASVAAGTKLLKIGGTGTIRVGSVTVGGVTQSGLQLAYASDGVYVACASYGGNGYISVAAAIDAAVAADGDVSTITILDGSTTLPAGYEQYYIDNGTVCKCLAYVSKNSGTSTIYCNDAMAVAMQTYSGANAYDYVMVLQSGEVELMWFPGYKLKNPNGATITFSNVTEEYTLEYSEEDGLRTYANSTSNRATTYTWTGADSTEAASGDERSWGVAGNWTFVDSSSQQTIATRCPQAGDTVIVGEDATISLSADATATTLYISGLVVFCKGSDLPSQVTRTLTLSDSVVLTDAAATLTVSGGVTMTTPAPTTTVSRSRIRSSTSDGATTYRVEVIPGTIFSVW